MILQAPTMTFPFLMVKVLGYPRQKGGGIGNAGARRYSRDPAAIAPIEL